jgi:MFS family permease
MLRAIGSTIFGIVADRYGRKWPFVINNIMFIVFELATGFCTTFEPGLPEYNEKPNAQKTLGNNSHGNTTRNNNQYCNNANYCSDRSGSYSSALDNPTRVEAVHISRLAFKNMIISKFAGWRLER